MKTFRALLRELKGYYRYLVVGFFGLLVSTAVQLIAPRIIANIVGQIASPTPELVDATTRSALILLGLYAIRAFATYLRSYYTHFAAWHFIKDLRIKVYKKLQGMSLGYYHDKQVGQLISRTANDTRDIEELIAHGLPDSVASAIVLVGVTVILFTINAQLSIFVFLTLPLFVLLVVRFGKAVFPMFKEGHQKNAEFVAVLSENYNGIKEIQAFCKEERESERVKQAAAAHTSITLRALKKSARYHPLISFIGEISTVLIIGVGGTLAAGGVVTVTDIAAFFIYIGMFYQPLSTLARLNEGLQNSLACSGRVFEILNTPQEITESPNAKELKVTKGKVEFKNISFSYNKKRDVLKNINLTVEPGKIVALKGRTGIGKTTMASLLPRFYDPTEGEIYIDGVDIKTVTLSSLRKNISIVMQDTFLFDGTIAENIAYGVSSSGNELAMEQIIEASRKANAYEFIINMPEGFDTRIGERGVKLSGGQKQRLSIARAILRNAPILILDEATSSVDMETEKLIHDALETVMKDRTTIVISHRLDSLQRADVVFEL